MSKEIFIKIGGELKQVKNVWIKQNGVLKEKVVPKANISGVIKNFILYTINVNTTISFDESQARTRSTTINIPDLISIDSISVDTGNVTYSVNGNQLTINVSNGVSTSSSYNSTKYSKSASGYRTSSSNSFSTTYSYSDGSGYSGTLYKNGSSYVSSGSPADTKTITGYGQTTSRLYEYVKWNGTEWKPDGQSPLPPATTSYSSGGYTGTLDLYMVELLPEETYTLPSNPWIGQRAARAAQVAIIAYSGTVSKPDTRIYRQNYSGTVYKGGTDYYYAYNVNLAYTKKNI